MNSFKFLFGKGRHPKDWADTMSTSLSLDQNDLQARSPTEYTVSLKLLAIKTWAFLTHKGAESMLPVC